MNYHATYIQKKYPDTNIVWSTHNHNDIGTACENSLRAITHGPATQIECTINGVGERAWNASLEQLALQIHLYGKQMGLYHTLNIQYLQELSDLISDKMLIRQANWPITGDNAARHTSWWHVNALLKNPSVYQPFDPKIVGKPWISLLFGPSSWWNHAREIITKAGYDCSKEISASVAQYLKDLYADRYKGISDEEVVAWYLLFLRKWV